MPDIVYEVMVDWDCTNWASAPDFTAAIDDISADVAAVEVIRGKEREEGNAPASTLQIRISPGICSKYSPFYAAGDLFNKIRPWLPVRVRATHLTVVYDVFYGFISSFRIDPNLDRQQVTIYATDGIDLLARQMITLDYETKTKMSDGNAINELLDVAGWPAYRRTVDVSGGGDLLNYPTTYEY